MTKKSKPFKKVIIITLSFASALVLGYFGINQLFTLSLEEELTKLATELNKRVPMKIDEFMRLDSATTIGETNFIYHYTIIGIEENGISADTIRNHIRPQLIDYVKSSEDLKPFRDNSVTLDYKYYNEKGKLATEISVGPGIYNER